MSDSSANATVIPFVGRRERRGERNAAERLHLAEAVRMAEAIVFASAEPVSERAARPRACRRASTSRP